MALLGNKAVGSVVKLKVSGVAMEFIIVHQGIPSSLYDSSCDGTWLLMKDIYETKKRDGTKNDYKNSGMHTYLNGTFLNFFDSDIKSAIKQAKIPYQNGTGSGGSIASGSSGLSAKIFLLSGYEVGFTTSDSSYFPVDGAKLSYFETGTGTSANNKRIANLNGSAAEWWLRSPDTSNTAGLWRVNTNGGYRSEYANYSYGVRPAFVLPSDITINDDGSVSTECTKASINLKNAITSDCIVACTLKVNGSIPDDAICNYEVTNNANDSIPVWEDCTNESKAGYPYVFKNKTSENGFAFSFRVSIERGSSNVSGYISSVSGGFKC